MSNSDPEPTIPPPAPAPFFVTGGTLPLNSASYVARAADAHLYQSLCQGEFCYVLNTRQMGKSSLMIRTARRLRAEGRRVIILDLTGVGQNLSVEQWYFGLLDLAASQTECEDELFDFWKSHKDLGPMQRFVAALRRVLPKLSAQSTDGTPQDLVIFVDEIDAVRSLPFSADEFFAGIRECCNRNAQETQGSRLVFCLLGVATPSDLIQDTRVTPFNIGRRIALHDFTKEEAAPLLGGLRQYRDERRAEVLLERVLYWTGGHPYMTQRLCRAVADSLASQEQQGGLLAQDEIEDEALVDTLCGSLFLTKAARETDDNLAFVRTRLLHNEADRAALLDLYGQVRRGRSVRDEETNALCAVLRLSGVAKAQEGWLVLRNEIYARVFDTAWVAEHMPDAEVRRQQKAFRRGVLRTALAATVLLIVVSGLGARAYFAEKRARNAANSELMARKETQKQAERSSRLLYTTQMNLLQRAYNENEIGRAVDLLAQTAHSPYRGFEWNYWNRLLTRERLAIPISEMQSMVVWSRDERWIATQTQSTKDIPNFSLWEAHTGRLLRTFPGRTSVLLGVASPVASDRVAIVEAPQGKVGTVRIVDPLTGQTRCTLPGQAAEATLSADGNRVFTLEPQSDDHTRFRVWETRSGAPLFTTIVSGRQFFGTPIQSATVQSTADSRLVCFGSAHLRDNCAFTLLNTLTGKQEWIPSGEYNRYALSPSGRWFVVTNEPGQDACVFEIWDLKAHRRTATLHTQKPERVAGAVKGDYFMESLRFSPDERFIAGAGQSREQEGRLWIWNTADGKEQQALGGHQSLVYNYNVEFSPDGRWLFSCSRENNVRVWNTRSWQMVGIYPGSVLNPPLPTFDSRECLVVDNQAVRIYPIESRRAAETLAFSNTGTMAFHKDGRHLIVLGRASMLNEHKQKEYVVYDLITGKQRRIDIGTAPAFGINAEGTHVFFWKGPPGGAWAIDMRDSLTGEVIQSVYDRRLCYFVESPLWTALAAICYEGPSTPNMTPQYVLERHPQVVVWDMTTGKALARLNTLYKPLMARMAYERQILLVLDNEHLLHIWKFESPGVGIRELFHVDIGMREQDAASRASVSPDGKYISIVVAESNAVGRVEVYEIATGKPCTSNEHTIIYQPLNAFSHDGKYRIWADVQQNIHLMQGATGKEIRLFKCEGGDHMQTIFSPDSSRLVTSTVTGIVKLWDVETGAELMTLWKGPGVNGEMSFSRDGNFFGLRTNMNGESNTLLWDARPLSADPQKP